MACCDLYVLLDNVQFTKNNYQNRNRLIDQNGVVYWSTVPVRMAGHTDRKISERGFDVRLVGRRIDKAALVADGLNVISRGGGAIVAMADTLAACENSNLILGCTPGVAAIEAKEIAAAAPNALLIDVGKPTAAAAMHADQSARSGCPANEATSAYAAKPNAAMPPASPLAPSIKL
jgi:hypothetical protein